MKTYQESILWLYKQLPNFEKEGKKAYKGGVEKTLEFSKKLGSPHEKLKAIHIAGTNGKGSVSNIITSVLKEEGYSTGLYTSPHLVDFTERIKINGKQVSKNRVNEFILKNKSLITEHNCSFFEITTVMAFFFFAEEEVDFAIIETGLGGRLDSTNILSPIISVITNIGFDHMNILGNTLEKIATEKAGIIKPNTPVVIGSIKPELEGIFKNIASERDASIFFLDKEKQTFYESDLKGYYQKENQRTALKTIEVLSDIYQLNISEESVKNGLKNIKKNTGLRGRWEVIQEEPKIILEVGHNEDAFKIISKQLKNYKYDKLLVIIGMVNDKSLVPAISSLPKNSEIYFTRMETPRSYNTQDYKLKFEKLGANQNALYFENTELSIEKALKIATSKSLILIVGSHYLVGEAIVFFRKKNEQPRD